MKLQGLKKRNEYYAAYARTEPPMKRRKVKQLTRNVLLGKNVSSKNRQHTEKMKPDQSAPKKKNVTKKRKSKPKFIKCTNCKKWSHKKKLYGSRSYIQKTNCS